MSDDELFHAFGEPCRALGLELDDVELHGGVLRVTVTRSGGGLDLDLLTAVSRALSALLDEHDELAPGGRYELEVSSPGVERRLRRPEQYLRALGERVSVRTQPGTDGERRQEGVLRSADADAIWLLIDDGTERRIALADVERARTVFDWQAELAAHRAAEKAEKAADREVRRGRAAERRSTDKGQGAPTRNENGSGDSHVETERAARS